MPEDSVKEQPANFIKEDQGIATRNVAIGLGGAAILTGAAILGSGAFRGEQTQTTPPPDNTAAAASPTPPEKTVIPTPTGKVEVTFPPTASPTEAPKALPEIINKETVRFVTLSPEEIEKMGKDKIPVPDIVNNDGFSLVEVHTKDGRTMLAIRGDKDGEYKIAAPYNTKVVEALIKSSATFSTIAVADADRRWGYLVPTPTTSSLKIGDTVSGGKEILSFSYKKGSETARAFFSFLKSNFLDAPEDTLAIIIMGNASGAGQNTTKSAILTTPSGEVVLSSPK